MPPEKMMSEDCEELTPLALEIGEQESCPCPLLAEILGRVGPTHPPGSTVELALVVGVASDLISIV